MITSLREELNTGNSRVKNLKSQIARIRNPEGTRLAEIREQLAVGETRAEELRKEILRREKQRVDEKELRRTMESFEEVWKAMNLEEQRKLLSQLVEKVGYDGRTRQGDREFQIRRREGTGSERSFPMTRDDRALQVEITINRRKGRP